MLIGKYKSKYELLGVTIEYDGSLRRYVEIQQDFKKQIEENIAVFEENARFYDSSLNQLCLIRSRITTFIDDIIRELIKTNNLYNCTRQDFLQHSSYANLMIVTKQYDEYCELLKRKKDVQISIESTKAAREANSKITGLRWGLISNSIAEHLLYQLQNHLVVQQQTAEAEKYYNQAQNRIREQAEQRATIESRDYYNRIYVPQMKAAIYDVYGGIMLCYLKILNDAGEINIDSIGKYDYDRSQQILENLHNGTDNDRIIATALDLCPYNVNVYLEANKLDLYYSKLTTSGETLEDIALDIGVWGDIFDIINPSSPTDDEIIEKELDRLIENEIDTSDDNWKTRADTYMREAQRLIEKYPSSFAGYGLSAAFLIAKDYCNRHGGFWNDFKKNIAKFLANYTGEEEYAYHFDDILMLIYSTLGSYFREADEYLKHNWHNDSEQAMWHSVANIKRSLIPAIDGVQFFIQCMESSEKVASHWNERQKNDLLWFVYRFCAPHIIYKSIDNSIAIRYHIPLCERKFAIDIYDSLITQGVDKYESGHYAFEKKYNPQKFDLYGHDVWRDEISEIGKNYLNEPIRAKTSTQGCYIATCVYGSYDCPQVWTLRRYRDYTLDKTWYGRLFIKAYYKISPAIVNVFGDTIWFKSLWKKFLDQIIGNLKNKGVESSPYEDRKY